MVLQQFVCELVRPRFGVVAPEQHVQETMRWLCQAQDAVPGGGVARSYSLRWNRAHKKKGWLSAYPETTGYIIPTFFDYAAFSGDREYAERAMHMAAWEAEIQMENGA